MLEYNWARLMNKCMHAVITYCFTFLISEELYITKMMNTLLKLYQALFMYKKLAADDDTFLSWGWSKILQQKIFPSKHYDLMIFLFWSTILDKNKTLARTSARRYSET